MAPFVSTYDHTAHAVGGKRTKRMTRIVELLDANGPMTLDSMATELGTSVSTIRRDLSLLAGQQMLVRTHGAAQLLESRHELPVNLRNTRSREAKQAIAQATLDYIPRSQFAVGMSGGTTTACVVQAIAAAGYDRLRIVTNSLTIAQIVANHPRLKLSMSGGNLRPESLELVGLLAENTFKSINLGLAVLGADGVTATAVTTHDETEARTNHAMASHSAKVIVVVDGSKIGRATLAQMLPIDKVDILITDSSANPAVLQRIRDAGVEVRLVTATTQ